MIRSIDVTATRIEEDLVPVRAAIVVFNTENLQDAITKHGEQTVQSEIGRQVLFALREKLA